MTRKKMSDLHQEVNTLKQQLAAMTLDALRYRWLREETDDVHKLFVLADETSMYTTRVTFQRGQSLDESIDKTLANAGENV